MIYLMFPDGTGTICMIWHMFTGLLYYADPARPLTTVGEELLDDLDHYLYCLSV